LEKSRNEFNKLNANTVKISTRKASQLSLDVLNKNIPKMIGGSADLTGSNNTKAKDMNVITSNNFNGNYIHYGIREHGMAGVMNGIALHKGLIPYGGTFLVFTDYCRPSIRLSAIMNIPVIYVMTHDSIGLGEDGPTHQPVEHLASLRSIPNLTVIRPCDIIETIEAWECAINNTGPTILVLTRQNLPMLQKDNRKENLVNKGAYKIKDFKEYSNLKIRVVSMSSFELFEKNDDGYKNEILGNKPIFAIEAGVINGWEKYIKNENFVGMSTFGESGPYKDLYKHFKITDDYLIEKIIKTL
jgi:transketolase